MFLLLMVFVSLFFVFLDFRRTVDEPSIWYRPAHFSYPFLIMMAATVASISDPRVRWKWNLEELLAVGLTVLMAGLLWMTELAFDFRAGNWTALAIYFSPTFVCGTALHLRRRRDQHRED